MYATKNQVEEHLLYSINQKRTQMLRIAELRGLQNAETVSKSKELDQLILRYQRFMLLYS